MTAEEKSRAEQSKTKENKVYIFDTTLRDGEQCPGAALKHHEKMQIAYKLALLNVDVIEAGFPFSSPGDFESVRQIAAEVRGPSICGLSRATPQDIEATWDAVKVAEKPNPYIYRYQRHSYPGEIQEKPGRNPEHSQKYGSPGGIQMRGCGIFRGRCRTDGSVLPVQSD